MDGKYGLGAAIVIAIALNTMATESKSDRRTNIPTTSQILALRHSMSTHTEFAADYEKLMGDMVYGSRPSFAEAFAAVERFAQKVREA